MADTRKLIIIGSGPAGYTAGVYAARAELKPLMFAGEKHGGQLMDTTLVENWPGTEKGILGPELMSEMRQQAIKFGCDLIDKNVTRVDFSKRPFAIHLGGVPFDSAQGKPATSEVYYAEAVIVATGAESIMLGIPGEKELLGRGVSTCAVCDAPFFKQKNVFVVGGGDAAAEDALVLTKFAKKVYLVHRRDKLRASKIMAKRVKENNKIEILWNTQVKKIKGKDRVEEVVLETQGHSYTVTQRADGVFLAIGHKPATGIFKDQLELDEKGYIKVKMSYPNVTKTNLKGVFAAGDCVDYYYQQAVTAAGTGCQAALDAEKYLESKED